MSRSAWLRLLLWPTAVAVGIFGEWSAYGSDAARSWIPDLLTGWTMIACGLVAWSRRTESRSGILLAGAGFAWFAPNLADGFSTWVAAHLLYLHRGPLVQLVLTYPSGRTRGSLDRAAVMIGWGVALLTPPWRSQPLTIAAAGALAGVAYLPYATSVGAERRSRRMAVQASVALAAAFATTAIARLTVPTSAGQQATLLFYEAALCALALALLAGLVRRPSDDLAIADLVVDLAAFRSRALRDALARTLGDPTLAVGYWAGDSERYVDASGRAFEVPKAESARRVTRIEWDGRPVAVLVHDALVLDDPLLMHGVTTAARFAAANAALHAEVRSQMDEVAASRRRLLTAADEERGRLESRLQHGPARQLEDTLEMLGRASRSRPGGAATHSRLERARTQLAVALDELAELAAGLHPRSVTEGGLADALAALVERSPVTVRVEVSAPSLPDEVAVAAYFVCSEVLANVSKHARAANASLRVVARGGRLDILIVDDGVGGADLAGGAGLRGLQDRVEALDGTFMVESPLGGGTTVRAVLPV